MQYLIGLPVIGFVIMFILNIILAGLLALTYTTLTKEVPIVTLEFKKLDHNKFKAFLKDKEGDDLGAYEIFGDQWQLDAGFYKMEYFANLLGIESKYTLDRFQGRYKNIDDANSKKSISYQLESNSLVENFGFFFDTTYGSSTYEDIELNTLYTVLKTPTGLMVRKQYLETKGKKVNENYFDKAKKIIGL